MRGLRFSLLQLIVSILFVLIIAYFVMQIGGSKNSGTQTQDNEQTQPQNSMPFQNIQKESY